ncbi:MAG: dTDP-4-dehydrorhamnose reductase [Bacteroidales bacterium]|nr:dTDP-4-dehydrorhamnose reductase [Bacteroidales bacterium]
MNILVTGANGQLGTSIRELAAQQKAHRFIFSDVTSLQGRDTVYLDITNPDAVRLICESEQVDLIINCAGYTAVDKAEEDQVFCDLLNHRAPGILAGAAAQRGATLIHISTDYVFGGSSPLPIKEDFPPSPSGVYGITKLQGEMAVQESGCRFIIIRTAWMYSVHGKNFLKTMRRLTAERPEVKVVFDQAGTPTFAGDLAAFILHVISSGQLHKTGIYHYTDEGVCSWYDFACAIRDLSGNKARVLPCHSSEFPSKVVRPAYSVLDKTRVKETFGITIPHWYTSLKQLVEQL